MAKTNFLAAKALAFALMLAQLSSCASTNISSVWKDRTYHVRLHRILVIAIAKKPATKRTLEDEFVKQIKLRGTDAVASYDSLSEDKESDKETISATLDKFGADALLIARITDRQTVYTYTPNIYAPPAYYCTWENYCTYSYKNQVSIGYIDESKYAIMETNLYDAASDKLVWSASSETEISGSDQKFVRSYVKTIVRNMVKHKIFFD